LIIRNIEGEPDLSSHLSDTDIGAMAKAWKLLSRLHLEHASSWRLRVAGTVNDHAGLKGGGPTVASVAALVEACPNLYSIVLSLHISEVSLTNKSPWHAQTTSQLSYLNLSQSYQDPGCADMTLAEWLCGLCEPGSLHWPSPFEGLRDVVRLHMGHAMVRRKSLLAAAQESDALVRKTQDLEAELNARLRARLALLEDSKEYVSVRRIIGFQTIFLRLTPTHCQTKLEVME
jgi:hypothetical protein